MNGILLIDKPAGWTSFDVVAKIRGVLTNQHRQLHSQRGFCMESQRKDAESSTVSRTDAYGDRATELTDAAMDSKNSSADSSAGSQANRCKCRVKVGHAGTLDPFATGLLIVLIGKACKRQAEFMGLDKTYEFAIRLGQTSSTGDPEGELQTISDRQPARTEVEQALAEFTGQIRQIPPAHSAIKIDGQRAYKLAREGKDVEIPSRTVSIHSLKLISYDYPELKCIASVSKGTYIRSLAADIGDQLAVGAYCSQLRRTQIGSYDVEDAVAPDQSPEQLVASLRLL